MNSLETVNTSVSTSLLLEHLRCICTLLHLLRRGLRAILVIGGHLGATSVAYSLVRRQGCQVLLRLREISSRSSQGLIEDLLVGTFRDALPGTINMALRYLVRCFVHARCFASDLSQREYVGRVITIAQVR